MAPEALDRVEQRRLLAADVRAGADTQVDVEALPGPGDVVTEQAGNPRPVDGGAQAVGGHRVFAADVEPSLFGADGGAGDRHGLDQRERIALHDNPVLEGPGLGLVGVAHQVAGSPLLVGHATPLDARREGCTATTGEAGGGHLLDNPVGAHGECSLERPVAAVGPVVVEAPGIDDAHPGEQPQVGRAHLGQADRGGGGATRDRHGHLVDTAGCNRDVVVAAALDQDGGAALALAEARAGLGVVAGCSQLVDQAEGSDRTAGNVVADVHHVGGLGGLVGEQVVEGRHAVGLGRWHLELPAGVVEAAGADPARGSLDGVKRGKQQVTALGRPCMSGIDEALALHDDHGAEVGDDLVDGDALFVGGFGIAEPQVRHRPGTPACRPGWPQP